MNSTTHTLVKSNGRNTHQENPFATIAGTMPTVSVVIPALNEAENLPHVLPRIPREWVDEVLLVDGHSVDDTVAVARELWPDIRIIYQEGKGKGAALRSGFAAATGDIIVMLDADGSTDPAEIPLFVGALIAGADYVTGSRFIQGAGTLDMPAYRKLGNWALTMLTNVLFQTRYTDITYGYNASWSWCAPGLALEIDGWSSEIITNIRAAYSGLRVVEVPCFEHSRITGQAKLHAFSAGWAILKSIIKERLRLRKKRAIWEKRDVVGDSVFTPAMQLLRREALNLLSKSKHLSPEAYRHALDAIKEAYKQLLELETNHPDAKLLQKQYKKELDSVLYFLEYSAEIKNVAI
jgi:glycosyltransferase involved in cell wall biosynthesis